MYQNAYYQRQKNLVHIWDDKRGYFNFPYTRYAYEKADRGEFTTLYGDKVTKIYKFHKDDPGLFESDVAETTRVLVDTYTESDLPSEGHITLTYDIECEMESGLPDPEQAENELTSIALHDSATNQYWVLVMDKDGEMLEKTTDKCIVIPFRTEEEMLLKYLDLYEMINPTIVTGWNIDYFDTPMLYNRIKRLLGEQTANRLSPIGECFWSPYRKRYFMAGVSYLDYISLYKNFTYTQLASYRLDAVAQKELGRGKIEYDGNLDILFKEDIEKFIEYNLVDVELVVEFDKKLQFIDTARGICHAGHVPYEDFVYSSKYLEGALLTYLKRRNIVSPNKPADRREMMEALKQEGGGKFIGAYVKAPIVGKHEWIYDLDLTSLYPSIIMTINISPETKVGKIENWDAQEFVKDKRETWEINGDTITQDNLKIFFEKSKFSVASNGVLYRTDKVGLIPDVLDLWFSQRVEFKNQMKKYGKEGDTAKYEWYKNRQLVQKILLNSLYGVLGLPAFRFYDIDNAEAVTTTGQTVIKATADMANIKYNKELGDADADSNIYIDTDSVFFSAVPLLDHRLPKWRDLDQVDIAVYVDNIAGEMQDYLNDFYDILAERVFNVDKTKHRFEIKKEYVSKSGIWIAKKRYAQWIISDNGVPCDRLDVKGLDVVRSSYPQAFRDFMSNVLIEILRGDTEEELTDRVYDFKKSLSSMSVLKIAKAGGVKNLNKYMPKNKKQTAMFQFQSGTPAHVKASIAYNQLITHFKVQNQYEPLKGGDKIKWVYLKQNPYGLGAVGFNGYNDPPQIMELINTYIDYDKIFERELLKKLEDFYNALGWGEVLSSTKTAEKFFSF
jgi:DNA polymerase elongation subunit (family B)|tara:strand:+ start:3463 stop:5985 length:2523 start_codon:yes stop_codon:yes gene_type:complete